MSQDNHDIASMVEELLQELENSEENTKIGVPRGVMSYAKTYQKRLSFLNDDVLKRNISYLLMLNDLYIWVLRRFQLVPGIGDMLIKNIITNFGFAIEGINKSIAKNLINKKEIGFDSASTILMKNKLITKNMKKEIRWVYDIRNKQHYDTYPKLEFGHYTLKDYKKAKKIWENFVESIRENIDEK